MSPAVERREHSRRHSPRRSSPRSERFPPPGISSPKARSPSRNTSSHRGRSPVKEMLPDRLRSPKQTRKRYSASPPSTDTKRIRAQSEREAQKFSEREQGRNPNREEQDKGRHRDRREARDSPRRDAAVSTERNPNRRYSSRSPPRASRAAVRDEVSGDIHSSALYDGDFDSVSKMKATESALEAKEKDKQKPSFELSGKLAEETNRVRGITILFTEPPDACKPDVRWRLYVFKAGEVLNEPLYVHRQSCYLFGRERRVADIPTDHPSCSKQHAVLQYRSVEKEQSDGLTKTQVRPYLMDLGSTNGTFINDNRIESQRYYELIEKDTIKFGNSSREYVMLHENSTS
ncbi:FHA domain-containing protein DDL [Platanthera zijinensis]|uniref:FHA domain-containing protein DDL n=1 Tax=Platanthera zijinensis TaxID=2320716 RepID=A0AAP0BHW5_9ASPA